MNAEMLTLKQTAERLGISTSTAKKLAAVGKLPAAKIGGQWRVHRERLEAQFGLVARSGNQPSIAPERMRVQRAQLVLGPNDDGEDQAITVTVDALDIVSFDLVLTKSQSIELAAALIKVGAA